MDVENTVQASTTLLERMAEKPEAVLAALGPTERERTIAELRVLADRAAGVQAEADLLYVADAVYRLAERTPALAALVLPRGVGVTELQERRRTRKITAAYDEAAYRKSQYAQERAAQIRNHVVRCRERLERTLREPPQQGQR